MSAHGMYGTEKWLDGMYLAWWRSEGGGYEYAEEEYRSRGAARRAAFRGYQTSWHLRRINLRGYGAAPVTK